jgi:hypothetical protein
LQRAANSGHQPSCACKSTEITKPKCFTANLLVRVMLGR